ncbi:MAG: glycosyltransferase family 2 protein [bacterium]|nr:glycosyltransferase family 2 protein [bacterium]
MSDPCISLCMIMRNEESMLPDFLSSVEGLWDEFIVVDTGSTDNSVKLVQSAGAKVSHIPWEDDFSAARNASLKAATGRWIVFLDADERPTSELIAQIKKISLDSSVGAATVVMRNEWPDGTRRDNPLLRVFRNNAKIFFEHPIHEDASVSVRDFLARENMQLVHLPGIVIHLGYTREVAQDRNKKERDLEILNQALNEDEKDFYCWFKTLEIARFWEDQELWTQNAEKAARLLVNSSAEEISDLKQRPFGGEFAALVAQGLPRDLTAKLKWLEDSVQYITPTKTWHLRHGIFLEEMGKSGKSRSAYNNCLQDITSPQSSPFEESPNEAVTLRAHLGLCRLAMTDGDVESATASAKQASCVNPVDDEALLACLVNYSQMDPENQPARFIEEHLKDFPQAFLAVAQNLIGFGRVDLAGSLLRPIQDQDHSVAIPLSDDQLANAAIGWLLCCLVLGYEVDLVVDLSQEEADQLLKNWIHLLWQSRNTENMSSFADGCGSILGIFPWLGDFLQEETDRLK